MFASPEFEQRNPIKAPIITVFQIKTINIIIASSQTNNVFVILELGEYQVKKEIKIKKSFIKLFSRQTTTLEICF